VLLARKVLVRLLEVLEVEHTVDNRADLVGGDHPVHVVELGDAADEDAAEDGGGGDEHARDLAHVTSASDETNDVDVARHAHGREGLVQGPGTANFNNVVNAPPARLSKRQPHVTISERRDVRSP
jgi:hypothetical protein